MDNAKEPPRIAGPVAEPLKPHTPPPRGAWDTHAHIFGPAGKFPFTPGRGYTPPDAPVERYVALLDHFGFARGVLVQATRHGFATPLCCAALEPHPRRRPAVATP